LGENGRGSGAMATIGNNSGLPSPTTLISFFPTLDDEITVEQFLTAQCDKILMVGVDLRLFAHLYSQDLRQHGNSLIEKLRREYEDGANEIKQLILEVSSSSKKMCVTLKCIAGAHLGQKFRLEPGNENGEDVFKMGRSTGRLFREKGVSLYKDKEISTTHARVCALAFLID
jgi:hypothetical protein